MAQTRCRHEFWVINTGLNIDKQHVEVLKCVKCQYITVAIIKT